MGKQNIIPQFVGLLLNGEDDTGVNRIGHGRNDQAKQFGPAGPQGPGRGVRHIAHLLSQQLDARLGRRRKVRRIPQSLGDGVDRHARLLGDVSKPCQRLAPRQ